MSTWRQHAAPLIARILLETAGRPEAEIRRALRVAFPWGERDNWPYRVWRDEIAAQRNGKRPSLRGRRRPPQSVRGAGAGGDRRQLPLFEASST